MPQAGHFWLRRSPNPTLERPMTQRQLLLVLLALASACKGTSSGAPEAASTTPKVEAPPTSPAAAPAPSPSSASADPTTTPAARPGFGFDSDAAGSTPAGFVFGKTGGGAPGRWLVKNEPGSPSGANVLAQLDADSTNFRFPLALAKEPRARDVRVSVRCKMVSGRVDQACGLVARYADENNYFITRANALENNIRLYTVKDGRRHQLASAEVRVTAGEWHTYGFELRGDRLQVFWDGKRVLDHRDSTFAEAGLCGVWTKADSVTYFDDLAIEAL
jgi:hypothetical protein